MPLNDRSLKNLEGVHEDLVRVVTLASERCPFLVTEGRRTLERQKMLKAAGKSKSLDSRHLTGHAVDLCDMDGCYDMPDMRAIARAMKAAAAELDVKIAWGGDWKKFVDTPHFELDRKTYPASGISTARKVVEAVKTKVGVGVTTGGGVAVATEAAPALPSPPDLGWLTAWQGFGDQAASLLKWAGANPLITFCLAAYLGAIYALPRIAARFSWSASS